MSDQRVVDTLNELLGAIAKSPHAHLDEIGVFVSATGTEAYDVVRRILDEERQSAAELADMLIEVGGVPIVFRAPEVQAGRLHYLDAPFLLKDMLHYKTRRLDECQRALECLSGAAQAYQLVSRTAALHREHLDLLRGLVARTNPSSLECP